MARPPKKGSIARELGISAAAFSRYVKRGCPVHSTEAARDWQRRNIDPTQRLARGLYLAPPARRDEGAELALLLLDRLIPVMHNNGKLAAEHLYVLEALGRLAVADRHLWPALRGILRAVPAELRPDALRRLPDDLIRDLAAPVAQLIAAGGEPTAPAGPDDDDTAAALLYEIVAGEWQAACEPAA